MNKKIKCISAVISAVVIAGAGFGMGFLTRGLTQSQSVKSYDWAMDTILKYYYKELDEDKLSGVSLKALDGCLDIYSGYYTKEEYESKVSSNNGNMQGIGVSYEFVDSEVTGKGIYIASVVGNSPAYKSGLTAGTVITSASTSGAPAVTFDKADKFSSFVSSLNAGQEAVLHSAEGDFTVSKKAYKASYCSMSLNDKAYDCVYSDGTLEILPVETRTPYLPEGAAYLRLNEFYGNAPQEMSELLDKYVAEHCTSLILDLRSNGGGYVDVMQRISYLFTGSRQGVSDVAMTARYRAGNKVETYPIKKWAGANFLPADSQVYVLADSGTASASEALLGVLIDGNIVSPENVYISDYGDSYVDYHNAQGATVKDRRTYGKGIMQEFFVNHSTGEALKLTTAQIYWPKGGTIHGSGLTPETGCSTLDTVWTFYQDENGYDLTLVNAVKRIYAK